MNSPIHIAYCAGDKTGTLMLVTFVGDGMCENPDGEIENSGKKHGKSRISNFCYIQVIVFDLSYLPVAAVGT